MLPVKNVPLKASDHPGANSDQRSAAARKPAQRRECAARVKFGLKVISAVTPRPVAKAVQPKGNAEISAPLKVSAVPAARLLGANSSIPKSCSVT